MAAEQPAPMTAERFADIAGMCEIAITETFPAVEGRELVAEVRRLRDELQGFRDDDGISGTPEGDYMWNVVSLRKLLEKYGRHTEDCDVENSTGYHGHATCDCGWHKDSAALAGEPHEQREGEG